MSRPYPDLAHGECGASLIEVMIVAVILLLASLGIGYAIMQGEQENTQQSQLQNKLFAHFADLPNASGTFSQISVPVTVTVTSAGVNASSPVSVAISTVSASNQATVIYQTEPSA